MNHAIVVYFMDKKKKEVRSKKDIDRSIKELKRQHPIVA
jgi:hypothetical protein